MTALSFVSVGVGAVLGAWVRWALSIILPSPPMFFPMGTFVANLIGGFLIGASVEYLSLQPSISPQVKLFLVTGLLGALTTFSTFSMEAVSLIMRQQYLTCVLHVSLHVFGSISFTVLGVLSIRAIHN